MKGRTERWGGEHGLKWAGRGAGHERVWTNRLCGCKDGNRHRNRGARKGMDGHRYVRERANSAIMHRKPWILSIVFLTC